MSDLKLAIENLYSTFGKYTTDGIHHCNCGCIDEADVKKLSSKPLRQLEEDDLIAYHGSALYTWGDVEHYKHYLPRICELHSVKRSFSYVDVGDIYVKLEYAKWQEWSQDETQAIKDYVLADWADFVNKHRAEINGMVLENYGKFFNISTLLRLWEIFSSQRALKNFVYFFYQYGSQILNGGLRVGDRKYETEFLQMIHERQLLSQLEHSFFENETKDPEYAESVSVVLQMIEQELSARK